MSKKIQGRPAEHGVYSWISSGKITPSIQGSRRLQRYLEDYERALIREITGDNPGTLTPSRELLVKSVVEGYGVLLLSMMYVKKHGILDPEKIKKGIVSLQPVLSTSMIAYMNSIRQNLSALGLPADRIDEAFDRPLQEKMNHRSG